MLILDRSRTFHSQIFSIFIQQFTNEDSDIVNHIFSPWMIVLTVTPSILPQYIQFMVHSFPAFSSLKPVNLEVYAYPFLLLLMLFAGWPQ